ncbi:hypothetical protein [Thermomonospora amylolytica]|nr:hypothetical protein [Thermomonospora amylolytica]
MRAERQPHIGDMVGPKAAGSIGDIAGGVDTMAQNRSSAEDSSMVI